MAGRHSNTANNLRRPLRCASLSPLSRSPQYTFSVEIVPICKDDLICLPRKLFQALGGIGPVVLCTRVSNTLTLMCPKTLHTAHQNAEQYWCVPVSSEQSWRRAVLVGHYLGSILGTLCPWVKPDDLLSFL